MPYFDIIPHVGIYGKLPFNGDFFHRGLTIDIVSKLDLFHQQYLYTLENNHQKDWKNIFLNQSSLSLYINTDVLSKDAFIALISPSYDSVDRPFPFTIMIPVKGYQQLVESFQLTNELLVSIQHTINEVFNRNINNFDFFNQVIEEKIHQIFIKIKNNEKKTQLQESYAKYDLAIQQGESLCWHTYYEPEYIHHFKTLPQLQRRMITMSTSHKNYLPKKQYDSASMDEKTKVIEANSFLSTHHLVSTTITTIPTTTSSLTSEVLTTKYDDPLYSAELISQGDAIKKSYDTVNETVHTRQHFSDIFPTATFTHIGNVRKANEDAYLAAPMKGLWVVADGVGGLQQGDFASQNVITFSDEINLFGNITQRTQQLIQQLKKSNQNIFNVTTQQGIQSATTVVALLYTQGQCAVVWAGDSRLYKLSHTRFEQITTDHCDNDPSEKISHSINRAIGIANDIELDFLLFPVAVGDRLLLCSDGVYNHLDDAKIASILSYESIDESSDELKKYILNTSANDNLTAIIIDII